MYAITPKTRLQQYARHKFGEYKAMEKVCGLTHGTLSYPSEPNVRVLQKVLEACPDLSPDWLILGTGSMERERQMTAAPIRKEDKASDENSYHLQGTSSEPIITIPSSVLTMLQQQLAQKDQQISQLLRIMDKFHCTPPE